jgi:taurine--2-oxoglutarate transaminase
VSPEADPEPDVAGKKSADMLVEATDLKNKHKRFVLTPWSAQAALDPPVIVRAEGVRLYDADGKAYLDLSSGLIAVNLGHGHPRMLAAIREQSERVCYVAPAWFNDRRAELAEALVGLAPWDEGGRVAFTTGGAEANEDALKIARSVTGRSKVLTAYRSFHGSAFGAGTLSGENRRWPSEPGIPGVVHFFAPFPYRSPFHTDDPAEESRRALAHLADVLSYEDAQRVAAIVLEPIVGSNGVIIYPDGYLAGVRELCDRHGILLVFDEVMTGFGRTGAAFAGERFGVVPDAITFAKGVTSAYVPLGGFILRERYARVFDERPLPAGHTYSGHPLAAAAGVAALAAYRDEGLFARANEIETRLRTGLAGVASRHPVIGDVRGAGAFFALEFVSDRATREPLVAWQGAGPGVMSAFFASLRRRGAYAFGRYNVAHIAPPLVASDADIDEAVALIDAAAGDLEAAL